MIRRAARVGPASGELSAIDVTAPAFKADPFPYYARLRHEAPVLPVMVPRMGRAWLVTRYDDVVAVLKDERLVKNPREAMTREQMKKVRTLPRMLSALQTSLLSTDGHDHHRLRALVRHAFTDRRIEQMREQAQVLAESRIDTCPSGWARITAWAPHWPGWKAKSPSRPCYGVPRAWPCRSILAWRGGIIGAQPTEDTANDRYRCC